MHVVPSMNIQYAYEICDPFCQTLILIHHEASCGTSVGRIANYYVNLSYCRVHQLSYFSANNCNIHTTAVGEIPKDQRNFIGMNYNYKN
jgi:hypothetical protein